MKKIYRMLFVFFAWLHLPLLAMKFYALSAKYSAQIGAAKIYGNDPYLIDAISRWAQESDDGKAQPTDIEEFPF